MFKKKLLNKIQQKQTNKKEVCNKNTALELSQNHPSPLWSVEKSSFRKPVPGAKKGWGALLTLKPSIICGRTSSKVDLLPLSV